MRGPVISDANYSIPSPRRYARTKDLHLLWLIPNPDEKWISGSCKFCMSKCVQHAKGTAKQTSSQNLRRFANPDSECNEYSYSCMMHQAETIQSNSKQKVEKSRIHLLVVLRLEWVGLLLNLRGRIRCQNWLNLVASTRRTKFKCFWNIAITKVAERWGKRNNWAHFGIWFPFHLYLEFMAWAEALLTICIFHHFNSKTAHHRLGPIEGCLDKSRTTKMRTRTKSSVQNV